MTNKKFPCDGCGQPISMGFNIEDKRFCIYCEMKYIDPELMVDNMQMYIYQYNPLTTNHTGSFFWDYKRFPGEPYKITSIEDYNETMKKWYPSRIDWLKGPEKSPHYCGRCGSEHVAIDFGTDKLSCIECWNNYGKYVDVNDWTKVNKERKEFARKFVKKCQHQ